MPEEQKQTYTGGKNKQGFLVAGAVINKSSQQKFGGGQDDYGDFIQTNNASHVADLMDDYGDEDYYDQKVEIERVSVVCANAIGEARNAAKMTQGDLAKKIGEKTSVVVDIENATAPNAQEAVTSPSTYPSLSLAVIDETIKSERP